MISSNVKEIVENILQDLPDDATLDDVIEAIYLRQRLARADEEIAAGETFSQEEVEDYVRRILE
jgi:hypothetical protein